MNLSTRLYRAAVLLALVAGTGRLAVAHQGENPGAGTMVRDIDYANVEEHSFGKAVPPAAATRAIAINMSDRFRFEPSVITVERGERVRLVVHNDGAMLHELVLGTRQELEQHAALMRKFPGMEHDEPHMAHVPPGRTLEIGWEFSHPGTFMYGCLIPGHFEAGMDGRIEVR